MPYIKVNPEKLNSSAQSLKRIEGEINKTEEEFRYVSRQLDWKVSCEKDIDWILRKIDNELCEQSKVFGEMALFLENTSEMYKQLEYFNNKKNDMTILECRTQKDIWGRIMLIFFNRKTLMMLFSVDMKILKEKKC